MISRLTFSSSVFKLSFALVLMMSFLPSFAQGEAKTGGWSLQDCIQYAEDHNLELIQKQLAVSQSEVDIEARKGALFPSLSFATNQNGSWRPWSNSYVNIMDGSMSATSSTLNYNGSYGFQAQWTVWNGGINRKQVEKSRVEMEKALTDVESTRKSLEEQIVQLYVQILYQTEAVKVCKDIQSSAVVQLKRGEEMYRVGSMSKADLAQLQAQESQEKYNVANAETQLSEFKMQLRQLLNLEYGKDFEVAIPSIDAKDLSSPLPDIATVFTYARLHRPEIKYNKLGIEAAEMEIDIAKRGYYPTVSLQGAINTSASSGLESNWAKQMKTNLSNSLGLTLSVPIFDNKQNATNVARAKLDRETSLVSLEQLEQQLYNSIETLWLNASNALQQYLYAEVNVDSMNESYSLVDEQFNVGLKDIVALITAKNNLMQAQQQLLQAKYTALLNRSLLKFYNGEDLTL